MTDKTLDLHALTGREIPTIKVEGAYDRVYDRCPDKPERLALRATAENAINRYAAVLAREAGKLIREAFGPDAHRAVFNRREEWAESDGSGVDINMDLLVVFDAAGEVLWYDREELSRTRLVMRRDEIEAYGGPVVPWLHGETKQAIEGLLEIAEDFADGYLSRCAGLVLGSTVIDGQEVPVVFDGDERELVIDDEIGRTVEVDSVSFDTLAEVLRRETAVIDGEDVDGLMDVIRVAVGAPPAREGLSVDAEKLRAWLTTWISEEYGHDLAWRPTPRRLVELVTAIDDGGLAGGAIELTPHLPAEADDRRIYATLTDDEAVIFSLDTRRGGRVCTIPQENRELRSDKRGVDAAVEAITYVVDLLNKAHGN